MVLRMAEIGEDFSLLFTPAGRELPEVFRHVANIKKLTGKPLVQPEGPSLVELMEKYQAIPNWRQRWCTKYIKIQPCQKYLNQFEEVELCVGLRADEDERPGGQYYDVDYRTPLREWGWTLRDVQDYIQSKGVEVPARTDCDCCFGQRLAEWYELWGTNPVRYKWAEDAEAQMGHTWRSAQRDTWPTALKDLRAAFESGRIPRGATEMIQLDLFDCPKMQRCRVCSM